MPCLKLCGRRWGIADDDIIFAATPWLFHLVWIILLPILLQTVKPPPGCERDEYRLAVISLFFLFIVALLEETAIVFVALRGSIFEAHKRRMVQPLLYLRAASLTAETAFLIYATVVVQRPGERCAKGSNDPVWDPPPVVRAWIWSTWGTVILTLISMAATFKFWPEMAKEKSWEHRVRLVSAMCCCSSRVSKPRDGGETTPLARMALVFASMFGFVDMTASDFLAAFLLAAQLQRCRRKAALQHLAEDADVIDAEAGALSPVDSALSTFSSARSTLSSMHTSRRRMTSGGIADLEAGDLQLRSHFGRRRARHTSGEVELAASSGGDGTKADQETLRRRATSESVRSRFGPNESPVDAPFGTATAAGREAQGSGAPGESPAGNTRGAGGSRKDASSGGGGEMAAAASPFAADQHQHPQRPLNAEAMRQGGAEDSRARRERTEEYLEDEVLDRRSGGQPPVRDMVAEGRRLLAAAEQEARHGAGAHAPLAELGEDHTSSAAGADARQSGGDVELLSPAEPVFSEAEQHGSDRAPVAERLGSSANPPAAPDAASGNAPADPAVATRGSPRTSAHEAPSPDDSAWGAGAATLPAGARQPAAAESAAPDEAGTAPAAAAADGSPDTKASRSPPWRRRRRPFHTASLLVQPSASGEAGLEHAHGSGLLTPSGMAADLRPERSAVSNLVTFSGDREKVGNEDVAEAAHYVKYSFAAYGYLLFVFSRPIYSGLLQLCCGRWFGLMRTLLFSRSTWRLRNLLPSAQAPIPGPGVSNALNREAIQQITGLEEEDILFVRFEGEGGLHCLPYFIALDREKRAVILSIRGTLSLEDAMTDLLCDSARLDDWMREVPSGGTPASFTSAQPPKRRAESDSKYAAHAGILDAAKAIVVDLQTTGVLRALFQQREASTDEQPDTVTSDEHPEEHQQPNGSAHPAIRQGSFVPINKVVAAVKAQAAAVAPAIQKLVPFPSDKDLEARLADINCDGWKLVVTGHSLGAGAAALVALYAHNYFPRVKCWAFEPPGGLMTRTVSRALQPLCTSTALGKDWIPRLSVAAFERMRDDMMMAAVRCKKSKWLFILGTLLGKHWDEDELFHSAEEVHPGPAAVLAQYRDAVAAARPGDPRDLALARQFVLPGRVMFMRPVKSSGQQRRKAAALKYEPVWVTCDDLASEGILISSRMMAEHMPDRLLRVLQRLAQHRTGNPQGTLAVSPAHCHAVDLPSPSSLSAGGNGGSNSGAAPSKGKGSRRSSLGWRRSSVNSTAWRANLTGAAPLDDLDFEEDGVSEDSD